MMQQSRPRQVSPLSMESNDSSFLSRYQSMDPGGSPYDAARAPHTSPPLSQHPSGSTTDGHSRSTSSRSPGSHLSSASSVARSSEGGNGMYSPVMSESNRPFNPRHEDSLLEHYHVLKGFLGASLAHDAIGKSSRARDKLLRLSPTQFHELSTDVYDELLRREDERQRRGAEVPRHLLPMKQFHPKRNQARQKLSTLPPERFKQLATDVYFELERRVPRLGGGSIERSASPAVSAAGSYRSGGPRGPPQGMRGPPGPPRPGSRGPPPGSRGPPPDRTQFPARSSSNDYGRPLPKTFQSNTIVPNKSTMVEGDDTDDEEQMGRGSPSGGSPDRNRGMDQEQVQAYDNQIAELQARVAGLESTVQERDQMLQTHETTRRDHESNLDNERSGWDRARSDLEQRVIDLQSAADSQNAELDKAHQAHAKREAGLHDQLEQTVSELQGQIEQLSDENGMLRLQSGSRSGQGSDDLREQIEMLEQELTSQRRVTEEVRENATHFLQEMRHLSEQSEAAFGKEEQLQEQIRTLQTEVDDWKARYAKTKTELRTLKASSIGLPLQNMARDALSSRHQLLSHEGKVNDVDVTSYQMSIDELLTTARQGSSDDTLDKMKLVIGHVQHITASTKDEYTGLPSPAESPNPMAPQTNGTPPTSATLKARVARNATGLITATRNFVSSDGLSPVSLVDAASANLTAAAVDFVKTVGIKASTSNDLRHDMDMDEGFEMLPSTTHVPKLKTNLPQAARNGQASANGWFSRLKGSFDSTYSNDMSPASLRDDDSEYNSYR